VLIGKIRNPNPIPHWIGTEDRFWFRVETEKGSEFVIVDAATGGRTPAFDHAAMARALSTASGNTVKADSLPIQGIRFLPSETVVQLGDRTWRCNLARVRCDSTGAIYSATEVPSPDGGGRLRARPQRLASGAGRPGATAHHRRGRIFRPR
jgi:hypothetical protein